MKIDDKILKKMGIAVGGFIIIIIIIAIIAGGKKNKSFTKEELDKKLVNLTKEYYIQNKKSLPLEGESKTISAEHFVTAGDIKELILKTGESCSGEINITNNNGYFLYTPFITCGDKKPLKLVDKITEDENIVTSGNGLYKINESYIFRGDDVNNYLSFAGRTWLILRVNSDGTLRILDITKGKKSSWDNRYNVEKKNYAGINDFVINNINSRIKDTLEAIYTDETIFTSEDKAYLINHDLCIGKRKKADTICDGSIECSNIIPNQPLGLIQTNEYVQASLEPSCQNINDVTCINYNYLADLPFRTWTITASGDNTYQVYRLDGNIETVNASSLNEVMVVANLHNNVLYSTGDGSALNPYIVN